MKSGLKCLPPQFIDVSTYTAMKSGLKGRQRALKNDFPEVSTYTAMKSGLKAYCRIGAFVSTYTAMKSGLKGQCKSGLVQKFSLNLYRDEKRTESV